ncbi:hypothetical protein [Mycobacterium sp. OTB74]|uniref:hypothetical protein n=1 Tax=Mycobacterium sp. OTB74 TaxID=1853452 RepID=UPI00247ECAC4|nr:hypothetical protein [Mycobacterium sp. OTB74]
MAVITPRVTTPILFDSSDSLLRFALRVDGTLCGLAGLLVAVTADPLGRLMGLSGTVTWLVGALLVGWGFALYVLAVSRRLRRVGVAVLVGNLAFSVLTVGALVAGVLPLTAVGVGIVWAFLAVGLGCAWLQYLGVRRLA